MEVAKRVGHQFEGTSQLRLRFAGLMTRDEDRALEGEQVSDLHVIQTMWHRECPGTFKDFKGTLVIFNVPQSLGECLQARGEFRVIGSVRRLGQTYRFLGVVQAFFKTAFGRVRVCERAVKPGESGMGWSQGRFGVLQGRYGASSLHLAGHHGAPGCRRDPRWPSRT